MPCGYYWRVQTALPRAPFSRRWWTAAAIGAGAILVAHLLDGAVWESLRDPRVNDRDWGRLLRSMGYLPLWIVAAVAVLLHGAGNEAAGGGAGSPVAGARLWRLACRRALLLLFGPAVSGLVAETVKLLVRRLRPDPERFAYVFRAFGDDTFSTRNLGMPSSHVMVAFGGAFALAYLYPRTRWVWFVLAAGCAATRVLALGHFLSDTVVAAVLSWIVVSVMHARILAGTLEPQSQGG